MLKKEYEKYFEDICGYDFQKQEFAYLCDVMRYPDKYEELGAKAPKNIMLVGAPGVGKTLMANCIIKASGRTSFICRKSDGDNDFIETIKDIFKKAVEAAPSIILLDDLDKFASCYQREASEHAAVQACIDDIKGEDVFIIATVNDLDEIEYSLRRPGRFDRILEVCAPSRKSAGLIIDKYFGEGKKLSEDISREALVELTNGMTAVEIKTLANEAAVYAGYERCDEIRMRHIVRAVVDSIGNIKCSNSGDNGETAGLTACHEAGHAVISEMLDPGSVAMVFAADVSSDSNGLMGRTRNSRGIRADQLRRDVLIALGGRAATEIMFGRPDKGSASDIRYAYKGTEEELCTICADGLEYIRPVMRSEYDDRKSKRDLAVRKRMMSYYEEAKGMLMQNREFLEQLTEELSRKGFLLQDEISAIKKKAASKEKGYA